MGKLEGKVVIVTGASRGIGRGIATRFAEEGAHLVVNSQSVDSLTPARQELENLGAKVVGVPGDIADVNVVDKIFDAALEAYGRLDLLVNNAGSFEGGPIDELSVEAWDRVIATNLRAPFLCTRAAVRIMKRQKQGRIINLGSISAQRVRYDSAPYSTSKHGIWGLTQVTALEGRQHGITCCCLHPGNILTERRVDSGQAADDEPMIGVQDIAEVALLMAALPANVEMLEAIVLPRDQLYVGRG